MVQKPNYFKNIIENIEKYDIVLLPYENEQNVTIKDCLHNYKIKNRELNNIAVVIGPEGGFSQSEIDMIKQHNNIFIVSLGNRILRTETAGLATLAMLSYEFEL